jgi:hypothetical protein
MDAKFDPNAIRRLAYEKSIVGSLAEEAAKVRARVRTPRRAQLALETRAGVGPKGAFAQVVMRGRGALAIEFGSRNNPPFAPLRKALR